MARVATSFFGPLFSFILKDVRMWRGRWRVCEAVGVSSWLLCLSVFPDNQSLGHPVSPYPWPRCYKNAVVSHWMLRLLLSNCANTEQCHRQCSLCLFPCGQRDDAICSAYKTLVHGFARLSRCFARARSFPAVTSKIDWEVLGKSVWQLIVRCALEKIKCIFESLKLPNWAPRKALYRHLGFTWSKRLARVQY